MSDAIESDGYRRAQLAMAELKAAVRTVVEASASEGLTNVEIGRMLGIYAGHIRHEGHIPRTILAMLESEGVVEQDAGSKRWHLCTRRSTNEEPVPTSP